MRFEDAVSIMDVDVWYQNSGFANMERPNDFDEQALLRRLYEHTRTEKEAAHICAVAYEAGRAEWEEEDGEKQICRDPKADASCCSSEGEIG